MRRTYDTRTARLTLNVDLGGRALDWIAGFLVCGHANEVPAVQDSIDPSDIKIAFDLMPSRTGSKRLSIYFPRVLDMRAWLSLASQADRKSFDNRVFRGAHRKIKITILAVSRCRCEKKRNAVSLIIKQSINRWAANIQNRSKIIVQFCYCYTRIQMLFLYINVKVSVIWSSFQRVSSNGQKCNN